ncbi:aminoglycoside phosphotransferase family protein [Cognatishimia sp. D5M38]|uniref:Aminoglycoside phosphotransferase family protein n=1 Tax=Cognatishimia coralii TaxID=3083254 RepID=A0ABU8QH53_9RHOB
MPKPSANTRPPRRLIELFAVLESEVLFENSNVAVWRVSTNELPNAALKFYKKGDKGNESDGFAFLSAAEGQYAAKVYDVVRDAALMEYLPGPSLGDLSRAQKDQQAAADLVEVANGLHASKPISGSRTQTVEQWLNALLTIETTSEAATSDRAHFERARQLAKDLLAAPEELCFLHGDLHHDNIRKTAPGYCAFDAKGVLGERAYELANAFRNPKGVETLVRDPDRVRFLRDLWSREFAVAPKRLMQWVCVKTALSISWRSGSRFSQDHEIDLLEIFFGILDETE